MENRSGSMVAGGLRDFVMLLSNTDIMKKLSCIDLSLNTFY